MADDISSPGDKADCGHPNPIWFADNELWNAVMGGKAAKDDPGGVLCPTCFMLKAGEVLRVSRPAPKADSALVRELRRLFQDDQLFADPGADLRWFVKNFGDRILAALSDRDVVLEEARAQEAHNG